MTSVDSGVDTGNDSNDSGQAEIQGFNGFVRGKSLTTNGSIDSINNKNQINETTDNNQSNISNLTTTKTLCLNKSSFNNSMPCLSRNDLEAGSSVSSLQVFFQFDNSQIDKEPLRLKTQYSSCHPDGFRLEDPRCSNVRHFFHNNELNIDKKMKALSSLKERCNLKGKFMMRNHRREALEPFYTSHWSRKMRLAAGTNNIELMTHILERGVSPNDADEQGRTALHLACSRGYSEMVKLLLDHGANPNQIDSLGNTPLHLAAITSKISVVTLLLKAGTNVLSSDRRGYNPLQLAQAKLRMLQNCKGSDTNRIKDEIHKVVNMLVAYLEKKNDVGEQIEALSSFCSKLSLSNTNDQVQGDVKNLLASIDSLSLAS